MELSGAVWSCLELSRAIWSYLELSGGGLSSPPPNWAKFRFKLLCHTYCTILYYTILMGFIPHVLVHTQMCIWSYLERSGAVWSYLELSGAIWNYLGGDCRPHHQIGLMPYLLTYLLYLLTYFTSGIHTTCSRAYTSAYLKLSGAVWSCLERSRAICSYLELSGAIWSYLKSSGAIWSYLEPLELSGAIWRYLSGAARRTRIQTH